MVLLAAALVIYGATLLYSASLNAYPNVSLGHPVVKQVIFAALGVGVMTAVAWLDYRVFGQMAPAVYVLAVLSLVAVLLIGNSAYGSTRWFAVAGQQVQASEIAKLLTIVALARFLADRQTQMEDPRIFA